MNNSISEIWSQIETKDESFPYNLKKYFFKNLNKTYLFQLNNKIKN